MSATFLEAFRQSGSDPSDSNWAGWLKRELAPTRARKIRTAIIVAGAALCVIISMALQVPELATSAYMVFFISKENKLLTIRNCAFPEWQSRCFSECGCPALLYSGRLDSFLALLSLSRNRLAKKFLHLN